MFIYMFNPTTTTTTTIELNATASVSETEQAKNVLAILSRVNSARDWMKKVKDLDALLAILAELKQFQVRTTTSCDDDDDDDDVKHNTL